MDKSIWQSMWRQLDIFLEHIAATTVNLIKHLNKNNFLHED